MRKIRARPLFLMLAVVLSGHNGGFSLNWQISVWKFYIFNNTIFFKTNASKKVAAYFSFQFFDAFALFFLGE